MRRVVLITLLALMVIGCAQPPSPSHPTEQLTEQGVENVSMADTQLDILEQQMEEMELLLSELENTTSLLEHT